MRRKARLTTSAGKAEAFIPISARSAGCGTSLASVTIPNSVTEIGREAFYGCTSLASVTIPNSVTEIGYDTFSGCTSLASVTIPDSVTRIGDGGGIFFGGAFSFCTSLASVTIPNSVTEIGMTAFSDCTSLASVTYTGTKAQWGALEKGYYWNSNVPATVVHCADGDAAL